jgi:hypothetical protein
VFRRFVAWAGLLGMLLHAGLVVHQRAAMGAGDVPHAVSIESDSDGGTLAKALLASMCRPGTATAGDSAPEPSEPDKSLTHCLACVPAGHSVLLPAMLRSPHPSLEPLPQRVAWHATQWLIKERTAERPPVRGPPGVA